MDHQIKNIKVAIGTINNTDQKSGCNQSNITTNHNNNENGTNHSFSDDNFELYFLK